MWRDGFRNWSQLGEFPPGHLPDGWASYAHLDEIDGGIYSHSVIIHDQHCVDPTDDRIHTQSIEGT
ncbi:hypothetical protein TCAL_16460 [Tigriopus californicus]|uniref:Uncharacterized protein n=1 Tax=Tigriopus californicus TaxID=6832 RepID=A0A553NMS6_TIGCA|nr:hypothetical protein TCAL_16460 [Tigriopus californicus]